MTAVGEDELLELMETMLSEYGYTVTTADSTNNDEGSDEDSEDDTAEESTTDDSAALSLALSQALQYVRNFCHIYDIPESLSATVASIACGYFLQKKWLAGALDDLYGVSGTVTSMKVGDTSVSYGSDGSSASSRVQTLINDLLDGGAGGGSNLIRHRRIRW